MEALDLGEFIDPFDNKMPSCPQCGSSHATFRCSRCKVSRYCSKKCFAKAWPEHRKVCIAKAPAQQSTTQGPELPPTMDVEDEATIPLLTFKRRDPKCARCGAETPVHDDVWRRYRVCCGNRTCASCEVELTGDDGEPHSSGAHLVGHGKTAHEKEVEKQKEATKKNLVSCPFCGVGAMCEDEEMVKVVREKAKEGIVEARFVLGVSLLYGLKKCDRQPSLGCKWLFLASRAGHYHALFELALCYRDGLNGHKPNPAKAARMLRRAAGRGGCAAALFELSKAYHAGEGVARDKKEAVRLLTLAADADFEQAKKKLAQLCVDGEEVEQDRAKAARLLGLKKTAELLEKGVSAPGFLFGGGSEDKDRAFVENEYTEAEMDSFFDGEDEDYETVSRHDAEQYFQRE